MAGDFDPALRAATPGAVRAALDGDATPVLRLKRRSIAVNAKPPPPRALSDVAPARGSAGVRGRALGALALTLRDVAEDSLTQFIVGGGNDLARGGGLRAGRYRISEDNALELRGVVFVPGVRVSGAVRRFGERRQRGQLRISGQNAPAGTLRLRGRRVTGRLAGARVSAILGAGSPARAAATRLPGPPPGPVAR